MNCTIPVSFHCFIVSFRDAFYHQHKILAIICAGFPITYDRDDDEYGVIQTRSRLQLSMSAVNWFVNRGEHSHSHSHSSLSRIRIRNLHAISAQRAEVLLNSTLCVIAERVPCLPPSLDATASLIEWAVAPSHTLVTHQRVEFDKQRSKWVKAT